MDKENTTATLCKKAEKNAKRGKAGKSFGVLSAFFLTLMCGTSAFATSTTSTTGSLNASEGAKSINSTVDGLGDIAATVLTNVLHIGIIVGVLICMCVLAYCIIKAVVSGNPRTTDECKSRAMKVIMLMIVLISIVGITKIIVSTMASAGLGYASIKSSTVSDLGNKIGLTSTATTP